MAEFVPYNRNQKTFLSAKAKNPHVCRARDP